LTLIGSNAIGVSDPSRVQALDFSFVAAAHSAVSVDGVSPIVHNHIIVSHSLTQYPVVVDVVVVVAKVISFHASSCRSQSHAPPKIFATLMA
jgi:hypothetical protein